ncbi:oxidoreductase [Actinosynnema sp. ALI-1.44]|uniref:quinone oxidoreductase family protein n=1 Tax=Actinosynnema sp. ALI-1.44 TaxID=1933779 RepID=UPI00097BE4B2|nr:zinc-binding dehydrogenase [Actinosynnema sp. ALI-1.44]ONI76393.1 oxidoreductase [Actinosynnema sp. ALI-1.44]
MRLVRYHEHGGPEVLLVENADVPSPADTEILIQVEAVGVNFIETQLRRGKAPFPSPLPGVPHGDVVGRIEGVGAEVTNLVAGDRVVAWIVQAAYADYVVVDAAQAMVIPESFDAAAATVLASTAQVAVSVLQIGQVKPGETVVVHAAAGAIGHLVVQLAKIHGVRTVIGTVGSSAKRDFVLAQGADAVVSYESDGWPDQVRELTGGVDVVLDSVEGKVFQPSLALLKPYGRLVYYGFAGATGGLAQLSVSDLFGLKCVVGAAFDVWLGSDPEGAAKARADLVEYMLTGQLRPAVHARVPLDEVADAQRIIEDRAQLGRVVLVP